MKRSRVPLEGGFSLLEPLEPRVLLDGTPEEQALELLSVSPALFVENRGQWAEESVRFVHSGAGANIAMTDAGLAFQLFVEDGEEVRMLSFSATFVGATTVTPVGLELSETVFNYHVGDDASRWREGVPTYEVVAYEGLYDGIDLRTWGLRSHLKYEFHVAPGADYSQILIRYDGIEGLSISADGSLVVDLGDGWGTLIDDAPVIYQEIDGEQIDVAGRFLLLDDETYSFEITGQFDASRELVIDPCLVWSTYMGGIDQPYVVGDTAKDIVLDSSGNIYVTGSTSTAGWVSGGFDTSYNGDNSDAYVVKLTSAGGHVWSTYLGGGKYDDGSGITVDSAGNVYVTGITESSGWTSGGFDTKYDGGSGDAFVVRLTSTGGHTWSTYLGGSANDGGSDIVVDSVGNVFATGTTGSPGWASGGFDTSHNGGADAFVAKLTGAGGHVWSSYLGGSGPGADSAKDNGLAIAVSGSGDVYVTGFTGSAGWTSGGFDTSHNGNSDAFVAKLTSAGGFLWSTYLGGSGPDEGRGLALSDSGDIYVAGKTWSSDWTSGGYDTSFNGWCDAFVAKLTSAGGHVWSTYLGGSGPDLGNGIAVDDSGFTYVTGFTGSAGWTSGGFDMTHNGYDDVFVVKLTGTGGHVWSTYMGGGGGDEGVGIAVDGLVVVVGGRTGSPGWVSGGYDTSHSGDPDSFVAKILDFVTGDADGDGKVDDYDLSQWKSCYDPIGDPGNTWAMGDWNGDEKIDSGDLALWQQNYDPIGSTAAGVGELAPLGQDDFDLASGASQGQSDTENLDVFSAPANAAPWAARLGTPERSRLLRPLSEPIDASVLDRGFPGAAAARSAPYSRLGRLSLREGDDLVDILQMSGLEIAV